MMGFIAIGLPLLILLGFGYYAYHCEIEEQQRYEDKWRRIREQRGYYED